MPVLLVQKTKLREAKSPQTDLQPCKSKVTILLIHLEFDHEKMTYNNKRDRRLIYNCWFNYRFGS